LRAANNITGEDSSMLSDSFLCDLLSTLSHDLRGSLSGVNSLNQIIDDEQRNALDENTRKRLSLIHNEYVLTNTKLTALSEYARLFGQKEALSSCNLAAIAYQGLDKARSKAVEDKHLLEITVNGIDALPALVGYESYWLHYFTELFFNSLQYAKPNTPVIKARLSAERLEDPVQWRINYEDNGAPLSAKEITYLIRPFKTLQVPKSTSYMAAGLGISRLTQVMQAHLGTLAISSGSDPDFTGLCVTSTVPVVCQ
jgi:light-regulated signal transduction histidine kinase (bacteriophytochrome)